VELGYKAPWQQYVECSCCGYVGYCDVCIYRDYVPPSPTAYHLICVEKVKLSGTCPVCGQVFA